MAITLVIQIITSNFPRVASRKKYMKLDVKGALLSYLLILLLFFFFNIIEALIMLYCVKLKTRSETEALLKLPFQRFILIMFLLRSKVKKRKTQDI